MHTQEHAQHVARKYQEEHQWDPHAKFAATATRKSAMFASFAVVEVQHKHTSAKDAKDQQLGNAPIVADHFKTKKV